MKYNYSNLISLSKGDPRTTVNLLYKFYKGLPITLPTRKIVDRSVLLGKDYLPNASQFFESRVDDVYKMQYLTLSAKVNPFNRLHFGVDYLDLALYPDIHLDNIRHNPLLEILNNRIYFK